MKFALKRLHAATILALSASSMICTNAVWADDTTDTKQQIEALKQQVKELTQKIEQLATKQEATAAKQEKIEAKASSEGSSFLKNSQFYGNLDLSIDDTTKGLQSSYAQGGSPVGRVGYMPAISTNLSYLGWRGKHSIGQDLDVVAQLETQIDIAATAGTTNTNSNNDTTVKGALTSRNSFVGLASKNWGAVKIGKPMHPTRHPPHA